jgi:hypothetical protein
MTNQIDAVSQAFIAKYAANVTELRFGSTVKVIKTGKHEVAVGWRILVEGIAGGHIMCAADTFLYKTTDNKTPWQNPSFVFENLVDAISHATALADNLGERGTVVDPSRGFISRYLNPISFNNQSIYWASEDGGQMMVLAR